MARDPNGNLLWSKSVEGGTGPQDLAFGPNSDTEVKETSPWTVAVPTRKDSETKSGKAPQRLYPQPTFALKL